MEQHHGLPFLSFWGFSPALDFQTISVANGMNFCREGSRHELQREGEAVLISGAGDSRHICSFLGSASMEREWHVVWHETNNEVMARNLLLLHVLTDDLPGNCDRRTCFLDVFGNTLLQEKTMIYMESQRKALVDWLSGDGEHWLSRLIDISMLSSKSRDSLCETLDSWSAASVFDIKGLRDERLRHFFGCRYDYRENQLDWFYHSSVRHVSPVSWPEYRRFGLTGIAHDLGSSSHCHPNRTLSACHEGLDRRRGVPVKVRGYWGDVITGPFQSLMPPDIIAQVCEANRKHEMNPGSVRNSQAALKYAESQIDSWSRSLSALLHEGRYESSSPSSQRIPPPDECCRKVSIITGNLEKELIKSRFLEYFDMLYIGLPSIQYITALKSGLGNSSATDSPKISGNVSWEDRVSKKSATLVMETLKYVAGVECDAKKSFCRKVTERLREAGWHAKYRVQKPSISSSPSNAGQASSVKESQAFEGELLEFKKHSAVEFASRSQPAEKDKS